MVRVLNVIGRRPTGGIGSVVKNYQSHFPYEIVYDYLLFSKDTTGDFDIFVEKMGSKVHVLPELKLKNLFKILLALKKFFFTHGNDYDIVHIHTVNVAFLVGRYAKKAGIENIIAHSHATQFSDKKLNALRNKILCLKLKKICTHYIACSEEAGSFLFGEEYMSAGKVKILKNAIDINDFLFSENKRSTFRKEFGLTDELVVANVGRLSQQKNQTFVIDIFYELKNLIPSSKLFIVGDGEEYENLRKKVKEYNLEKDVVFTGRRDDIEYILSGIDFFLMPSLYEGLPVIGVEALSSGLYCLFSKNISKEFICPKSMYIGLDEGSKVWANQIKLVVENKESYNRYVYFTKEMGYDINEQAPKLLKYYEEIVEQGV